MRLTLVREGGVSEGNIATRPIYRACRERLRDRDGLDSDDGREEYSKGVHVKEHGEVTDGSDAKALVDVVCSLRWELTDSPCAAEYMRGRVRQKQPGMAVPLGEGPEGVTLGAAIAVDHRLDRRRCGAERERRHADLACHRFRVAGE